MKEPTDAGQRPIRLSGFEFSCDPGNGSGYFVKENYPHRSVDITEYNAHEEVKVEVPFSVLKIIAQRIAEVGGMKVSELIKLLQVAKAQHGDVDVRYEHKAYAGDVPIRSVEIEGDGYIVLKE